MTRQLYPEQEAYIADMPQKFIMAAGLGSGKGSMSIAHYKHHASHLPLLIIAPASKTRDGSWEDELQAMGLDLSKLEYRIVSRERFTVGKTALKKPLWQEFAPRYNGGKVYAVIVDELHIGGRKATSAFSKKLQIVTRDTPFFIGLTATPLPNSWQDAEGYAVLFGHSRNATAFRNYYLNVSRFKGFPEVVGYYHEDELKRWWNSISKRLDRSQIAQLPDRIIQGIDVPSPNEYHTMLRTRMDGDEMLDSPPKLLHALRQSLISNKLEQVENTLNGTDENVLIWYTYNSERDALLELLTKYKEKTIYEVSGHAHTQPGKADWAKVTNSVTLCQYQSASAGIELTYATVSLYFSPTYSYADYSQSLGRNYRIGQTQKTLVLCLRTKGTVEEDIWSCLGNKGDFNESQWHKTIDKQVTTE